MIRRLLQRLRAQPLPPAPALAEPDLRLITPEGHPNINELWRLTKDIEALKLSVKSLGYELARSKESKLQGAPVEPPEPIGLESKPVTQSDIESRWLRGWCAELLERPRYHRSLWEAAFLLQALCDADALKPQGQVLSLDGGGASVLSYLAKRDLRQTLIGPGQAQRRENLIDQIQFNRSVRPAEGALDALPPGLADFDACWSMGAVNRMGSIAHGLDLVLAAMRTLKPGGVAVHMLDFNFADDEQTIDHWPSVLFQRRHIEHLVEALKAAGHQPARLDFHVGHQPLDRFVDMPPYDTDRTQAFDRLWRDGWQGAHLKANIDGFAVTSFGLIVRKART
jgi:hypothetical protein